MRINNKRVNVYIESIYTILFIGLVCSILLIFIPIPTITKYISPYILCAIFLFLIISLYKFGHQHVEYSSDGEVLNIKTGDSFWVKYFPKSRVVVDFPKHKLINYKIYNRILYKKLELYITSKRNQSGIAKLSFNITYLSQSEITDLKRSLSKIIKKNQLKENIDLAEAI
ncbi:MAG: hypothetical protein ACK5IC_02525 [Moheibacter sp.]